MFCFALFSDLVHFSHVPLVLVSCCCLSRCRQVPCGSASTPRKDTLKGRFAALGSARTNAGREAGAVGNRLEMKHSYQGQGRMSCVCEICSTQGLCNSYKHLHTQQQTVTLYKAKTIRIKRRNRPFKNRGYRLHPPTLQMGRATRPEGESGKRGLGPHDIPPRSNTGVPTAAPNMAGHTFLPHTQRTASRGTMCEATERAPQTGKD